jgi:hypothetical protein
LDRAKTPQGNAIPPMMSLKVLTGPDLDSNKMSHEEQWEADRGFLDDAISRGKEILLAIRLERPHIGR